MKNYLIPVKRVLKIINSAQNMDDINNCKILIKNYVKAAEKNKVVNIEDLNKRLNDELTQRHEALYLSDMFNE